MRDLRRICDVPQLSHGRQEKPTSGANVRDDSGKRSFPTEFLQQSLHAVDIICVFVFAVSNCTSLPLLDRFGRSRYERQVTRRLCAEDQSGENPTANECGQTKTHQLLLQAQVGEETAYLRYSIYYYYDSFLASYTTHVRLNCYSFALRHIDIATCLAEEFFEFPLLVRICEETGQQNKLFEYMERFAGENFSEYVFQVRSPAFVPVGTCWNCKCLTDLWVQADCSMCFPASICRHANLADDELLCKGLTVLLYKNLAVLLCRNLTVLLCKNVSVLR